MAVDTEFAALLRERDRVPDAVDRSRRPAFRWVMAAVVVMAILLVVFLRVWSLDHLGFNSDEAVYVGQAASLRGWSAYLDDFSPFRAHPLLFQYVVSVALAWIPPSSAGRLVAVVFGMATLPVVYMIGRELFDRRMGLLAAAFVGVMPIHVVVSRQALLEAPLTFFFAATMWAAVRYRATRSVWSAASVGVAAGLCFLSKEVGILALATLLVVIIVEGGYRVSHLIVGSAGFLLAVWPHLLAGRISQSGKGGADWLQYLIWQTSRPPNHPGSFYLVNLPHYLGVPLLVLAAWGLGRAIRSYSSYPNILLLVAWVLVPGLFFQVWKVKGYHYPVPIAPAAALLAAWVALSVFDRLWGMRRMAMATMVVAAFVGAAWVSAVNGPVVDNPARVGDAGFSGIPGGREMAVWMAESTPAGARSLSIGPSMSNIIRFYADREVEALSISPNPLRTNPAYAPIRNPDFQLRWGLIDYIVYDAYSAERSPHFANRMLDFISRYGGDLVYEQKALRPAESGESYLSPVIRVYRVKPVSPGAGA